MQLPPKRRQLNPSIYAKSAASDSKANAPETAGSNSKPAASLSPESLKTIVREGVRLGTAELKTEMRDVRKEFRMAEARNSRNFSVLHSFCKQIAKGQKTADGNPLVMPELELPDVYSPPPKSQLQLDMDEDEPAGSSATSSLSVHSLPPPPTGFYDNGNKKKQEPTSGINTKQQQKSPRTTVVPPTGDGVGKHKKIHRTRSVTSSPLADRKGWKPNRGGTEMSLQEYNQALSPTVLSFDTAAGADTEVEEECQ
eukprot:TRINITY_DN51644_c0_g2_i1.p1 TRINITY_DN51644_c0_g2~~TRINITY_DN51644_c0_g2_i1.p1  ORF type:complete len:254 (-),score=35.27 TRINITY_DN51644_c0_g2_i1:547-1308(-)